jgi:hypothetical protein
MSEDEDGDDESNAKRVRPDGFDSDPPDSEDDGDDDELDSNESADDAEDTESVAGLENQFQDLEDPLEGKDANLGQELSMKKSSNSDSDDNDDDDLNSVAQDESDGEFENELRQASYRNDDDFDEDDVEF